MDDVIRFIADDILLIIMALGTVLLLRSVPVRYWLRDYSYVAMAGLTALLIGKLMSLLYQPAVARPFLELGQAPGAEYIDNPGFPSDHALLATAIVVAVYALTPYRKTAYVMAGLVVIMGVGRVLALVHTPLDVVGGIVAALLGGLWYVGRARAMR